jgi:hypothetical protein
LQRLLSALSDIELRYDVKREELDAFDMSPTDRDARLQTLHELEVNEAAPFEAELAALEERTRHSAKPS